MKTTQKPRKNGLLVQPDDLEIGHYYAVHGLRNDPEHPVPVAGMAFRVKAMNLPFVIGQIVAEPSQPAITFDVRFLSFMRVSQEFVDAQRPAENQGTPA